MSTHKPIIIIVFISSCYATTANIPNGEKQAINALLASFLEASDYENLLQHGCWCSNINDEAIGRGGKEKVDELDEICANWFLIRRCTHWINGDCLEDDISHNHLDNSYLVDKDTITGEFDCSVNVNDCANTTCVIDVYYLNKIVEKISEINLDSTIEFPVIESTCPKGEKLSIENTPEINHTCAGHPPHLFVNVKIFTPEDAVAASLDVDIPFEVRDVWTGPTPVSNNLNYLNGARNYGFRSQSTENNNNSPGVSAQNSENFFAPPISGNIGNNPLRKKRNENSENPRKFAFDENAVIIETPDGDGGVVTSVDLRRHPYCGVLAGVIRNQGGCGSCWAFAAASSISDMQCFANNVLQELPSVQQLGACCDAEYGCTNGICLGGSFWKAHEYYRNYGLVTGNDYLVNLEGVPSDWTLYADGFHIGSGCYRFNEN